MKIPPKVELIVWKVSHGIMVTCANLHRRICEIEELCPKSGDEIETKVHTFLRCWWARKIIRLGGEMSKK